MADVIDERRTSSQAEPYLNPDLSAGSPPRNDQIDKSPLHRMAVNADGRDKKSERSESTGDTAAEGFKQTEVPAAPELPKVIVATLPTQRGYIVEASIVTTGFGRDRTAGEKWFNKSIWYNWYKVQIKDSQNNVWTCKKRYREFEALHSELQRNGVSLPPLPPKVFSVMGLGNLSEKNFTPETITRRKQDLNQILQNIVDNEVARDHELVHSFLAPPFLDSKNGVPRDDWPTTLTTPENQAIDLAVQDLPHEQAKVEWWYYNTHLKSAEGKEFSLFAAFFRFVLGKNEDGSVSHGHAINWAITDVKDKKYYQNSIVDPETPSFALIDVKRKERFDNADSKLTKALKELFRKKTVPMPDKIFSSPVQVADTHLELVYDGNRVTKDRNGNYLLTLDNPDGSQPGRTQRNAAQLRFQPLKNPIRNGRNGVVVGASGDDMFYYCITRMNVSGSITVNGTQYRVEGEGWYDHEFGGVLTSEMMNEDRSIPEEVKATQEVKEEPTEEKQPCVLAVEVVSFQRSFPQREASDGIVAADVDMSDIVQVSTEIEFRDRVQDTPFVTTATKHTYLDHLLRFDLSSPTNEGEKLHVRLFKNTLFYPGESGGEITSTKTLVATLELDAHNLQDEAFPEEKWYTMQSNENTGLISGSELRVCLALSKQSRENMEKAAPVEDQGEQATEEESKKQTDYAWNWTGLQLCDNTEITAAILTNPLTGEIVKGNNLAVVVSSSGLRHEYGPITFEPVREYRSVKTYQSYPAEWILKIPQIGAELTISATFDAQEFKSVTSFPAFWEGRVQVSGTVSYDATDSSKPSEQPREVFGVGYVERSGYSKLDTLDKFFREVGKEVLASVENCLPLNPTDDQMQDLVASEEDKHYLHGVSKEKFREALVKPIREVTDRGGKGWRSFALLACCESVGGDPESLVNWVCFPELVHVGSLIVDDIQDKSPIRRGGVSAHIKFGEAVAINAGTAAYFMGERLIKLPWLTDKELLKLYEYYFLCMRAGHTGQALDIVGLGNLMPHAIETGDIAQLRAELFAILRLKTAVPASCMARIGSTAGRGTDEQIRALGHFFENLGLAFQIIDDVLNLTGFKGKASNKELKDVGEDIKDGKITYPLVRALPKLDRQARERIWNTVASKPQDQEIVNGVINTLREVGALDECIQESRQMIEQAWEELDPLLPESFSKLMLRAFSWFIIERHY